MSRKKKFEDDGRTIADMSGLDGNVGGGKENFRQNSFSLGERGIGRDGGQERPVWEEQPGMSPFSWSERFRYMGAALGAALLIAFVFLGGIALVIWLITLYG